MDILSVFANRVNTNVHELNTLLNELEDPATQDHVWKMNETLCWRTICLRQALAQLPQTIHQLHQILYGATDEDDPRQKEVDKLVKKLLRPDRDLFLKIGLNMHRLGEVCRFNKLEQESTVLVKGKITSRTHFELCYSEVPAKRMRWLYSWTTTIFWCTTRPVRRFVFLRVVLISLFFFGRLSFPEDPTSIGQILQELSSKPRLLQMLLEGEGRFVNLMFDLVGSPDFNISSEAFSVIQVNWIFGKNNPLSRFFLLCFRMHLLNLVIRVWLLIIWTRLMILFVLSEP